MPTQKRARFVAELRAMRNEDDGFLDPANRAALVKLTNDPDIEQVWIKIEKFCGKQSNLIMRFFIRELLTARRLAEVADNWPDWLKHAKMAQSLAKFLKGSDRLPPPLPMIGGSELVALLEDVASRSRERAKMSQIRRSRQDCDGSRQYTLFMRLVSLTMREMFGHWFDHEVADLTNIFFPQAHATHESMRATRRPTTRKGRADKAATAS
jgi:hypothetical protein